MAKVFDNILISGLRGRIGSQLVFRVVNGVTIVSRAPERPDPKKESGAQRQTRATFRAASQWAKAQIANPERKHYYMQLAERWKLTNAYTAAIKDYMCKIRNQREPAGSTDSVNKHGHPMVRSRQDRTHIEPSLIRSIFRLRDISCRIKDSHAVKPVRAFPTDYAELAFTDYFYMTGRSRDTPDHKQMPVSDYRSTRDNPASG